MKILICYHSLTGNTEAIAKCMAEALTDEAVTIIPASEVDPDALSSYDVVFLGSGVYAASVGKSIKDLMAEASKQQLPPKFALFFTHATQEPGGHAKCFYRIEKQINGNNCTIVDKFECLGDTRPTDEQIEAMNPEQMEQYLENLQGHPNEQDFENAKKFAKKIIENL